MKQIKDMLIKESTEAMERDEKIIKLIEELKKYVINKVAASESSFNHPHPGTEMTHKLKEKSEEAPTLQSET